MTVQAIPDGYHSVTPYLIVHDGAAALDFYVKAFSAVEVMRLPMGEEGKLAHAEIRIGDSHVMLADEFPEMGAVSPQTLGGAAVSLMIYLDDVDSRVQRAVDAGCEVLRPLEDQFYGDRTATLKDPFGHQWTLATHVEDVADEEVQRRMAAMMD